MEISGLKKSIAEIAQTVGAIVEAKFGDRSQVEEHVRTTIKQVERVVGEAVAQALTKYRNFERAGTETAGEGTFGSAWQAPVILKFKKLAHFKGELPSYATPGASGMDVRACLDKAVILKPGERTLIPTGLSLEFPVGYEIQVRPRSGLAIKQGLSMVNTPGTVDADYRGELKVIVINHGQEAVTINDQDRIAQLVLAPVVQAQIELVEDLTDTTRGEGGFGSTGVQ